MGDDEDELPLSNIPPDPPNFSQNPYLNDTKGPPGGHRLGNRKFNQMMHDNKFREQIHELNSDPNGLGLPACTRDQLYRNIQCDADRKFNEMVDREKKDIEKRRTGKKKRKPLKYSNIAETSFIEETTSSKFTPSNDDTYSQDGSSHPPSQSMTELNRPATGVSFK